MSSKMMWFSNLEITPWWRRMLGYPPLCKRERYGSDGGAWTHTTYFSLSVRMDSTVEIRKMEKWPAGWAPKVYACDDAVAP